MDPRIDHLSNDNHINIDHLNSKVVQMKGEIVSLTQTTTSIAQQIVSLARTTSTISQNIDKMFQILQHQLQLRLQPEVQTETFTNSQSHQPTALSPTRTSLYEDLKRVFELCQQKQSNDAKDFISSFDSTPSPLRWLRKL